MYRYSNHALKAGTGKSSGLGEFWKTEPAKYPATAGGADDDVKGTGETSRDGELAGDV